jgi:nucleotide-binding universal stress UspA family protein
VGLFERVLVGVDGTDWGFAALRQALTLAPPDGSVVHAVTALDTRGTVWTGSRMGHWQQLLEHEAEQTRTEADAIMAGRSGCTARVETGAPVDVLRRARDELGATLLALGGRRSSRMLGLVMGDTATQLLHDARCSVLVARGGREDEAWTPARVVAGVDGSAESLAARAAAHDIAARLGGTAEVVSADNGTDPVTALVEPSDRADLVVVGARGLRGLKALGSVSERVAHQAKCSVLVVRM